MRGDRNCTDIAGASSRSRPNAGEVEFVIQGWTLGVPADRATVAADGRDLSFVPLTVTNKNNLMVRCEYS